MIAGLAIEVLAGKPYVLDDAARRGLRLAEWLIAGAPDDGSAAIRQRVRRAVRIRGRAVDVSGRGIYRPDWTAIAAHVVQDHHFHQQQCLGVRIDIAVEFAAVRKMENVTVLVNTIYPRDKEIEGPCPTLVLLFHQ